MMSPFLARKVARILFLHNDFNALCFPDVMPVRTLRVDEN